jgi:hypothetical protein
MDAAVATTIGHVTTARFEHLDETLADQPVVRQHVAEMQNAADRDFIGRAVCGLPLFG